jgi:predicted ester cyclase
MSTFSQAVSRHLFSLTIAAAFNRFVVGIRAEERMKKRREFLKLAFATAVGAVFTPVRALFGANAAVLNTRAVNTGALRVALADERIVRSFYGEGWNRGNKAIFDKHPALAGSCSKTFEQYRGAFPDLLITVVSLERQGEETHVRWRAQGTHRGALEGLQATGRRVNISGLTRMKFADEKIVWTAAEWDQKTLLRQLGAKVGG